MAVAEGSRLVEYIPVAARPRFGIAPPGALRPGDGGPLWRNSLNMAILDGVLRRRPAIIDGGAGLGPTQYSITSSAEEELPLAIISNYSPGAVGVSTVTNFPCADRYSPATSAQFCAVVTSRQIYVFNQNAGAWVNATPTYTTGTVTATNGSATVTGAGTAWLTSGLSPYQFIQINSAWYQICTIASDTSLTLTSNFAGATGAGKAYTIRRTWDLARTGLLNEACNISATLYNQNLLVAGRFLGRADGAVAPCLIQVADCLSAAPTTTYLTASTALVPGLDFISGLSDITGVQALQDGRIVMSGTGTAGPSTIFYSSPTNTAVWTVAPAGSTALVYLEGAITALGRVGDVLTIHYEDGIVLGHPTGQADPPLGYRPSAATDGCYAPRTLRTIGNAEYYVTSSGNVARFDLAGSQFVGDDARTAILLDDVTKANLRTCFSGYLRNRQELLIFQGNGARGYFAGVRLDDGTVWPYRAAANISACGSSDPFSGSYQDGSCLVGLRSTNGSAVERNLLWTFSEGSITDAPDDTGLDQSGFYATTDDLDFGDPLLYKSVLSVVVWLRAHERFASPPITESYRVSVSVDGGTSFVVSDKTVTVTTRTETPFQFSFIDEVYAAGLVRVRIGPTSELTSKCEITRVKIVVNSGGRLEQVEL